MKSKKNEMTPMPDTQISDALGLIDGGLQLLLAAVHADDPKREMLVRVGDLLRDVRSLEAALSGHVVVPREPTQAMLSAGDSKMPQIAEGQDITTGYDALKEAWPAMIQAAPPVPEMGG